MNGDRLLFLLKHELRLWNRSPQSLRKLLPLCGLMAVMELLGGFVLWALNHFQLPQTNFSADSPPDTAFWISGGIIYYFFYLALFGICFSKQQKSTEPEIQNWLISSPLSSRISFARILVSQALTATVSLNLSLLMYSAPLIVIYQSPSLWLGMHLTITAWAIIWINLGFWGICAASKWRDRRLWKIFRAIILSGPAVITIFLLVLPSSLDKNFLSRERIVQIILEQAKRGNLLGGDSWLWFPARAVFLDPLPSLIWIMTGIGLTWLTLQALHRPLSTDLQATFKPSRPIASDLKTPKPFKGDLLHLLILRDWKRIPELSWVLFYSLCLASYWMCLNPSGIFKIDHAVGLAIGSVLVPALNTSLLTHYCIAEDPMQDVLRSSPINFSQAKAYKRLAGLLPIWVSILPILIGLSIFRKSWVLVAVLALVATISHTYLRDWNSCPVKQTEVFSMDTDLDALGCRDGALTWIEGFSYLLWLIIAIFFLSKFIAVGMFFLSLEGYILFCAYRRNQQLGDSWSV
jgi:ABC-2 type transport system permease protein